MMPGKRVIWVILPIAAALAFLVFFFLQSRPVLTTIEPAVFTPGQPIRLRGQNFGTEQGKGRLLLDGFALTESSYLSWNDEEILFSLPLSVDSGLIQVSKPLGKSKPTVVINALRLPTAPADLPHAIPGPSITEILPQESGPGALIQIRGINFGSELHASQVRFSKNPERMALDTREDQAFPASDSVPQHFVLPENPEMYEHWDDKLIEVRVPEVAGSGPLVVSTPHGASEPYHFQVNQGSGSKYRFDPVSYSLEFAIEVDRKDQNSGGSLLVRFPNPPETFSQSIEEVQAESHPFQGGVGDSVSLVRLENPQAGLTRFSRTLLVRVHNVESELSSYSAGFSGAYSDPGSSGSAPLFLKQFLDAEEQIPSDEKVVKTLAAAIVGRERNLQRKAGLIRTWLASKLEWLADPVPDSSVLQDLGKRKAGSHNYSRIAVALFRAAGIPALPISGFLVGDEGQGIPHFWIEYYLPAVGWIPYDPVLVYGAVPAGFTPPFLGPALYFGSLDNRHIALYRGIAPLFNPPHQTQQTQGTQKTEPQPDQESIENAQGENEAEWYFPSPIGEGLGLEYSSDWKPIKILATY
jgi:hypothetical protein